MSKKPELSVILPVYNCENYISKSIESILCQTYQNFELIIVNDNSSDKSLKIIKNYIEKNQNFHIKLFNNKKNIGLAKSLNKILRLSTGKFLARMDGDDFNNNQRFEKQINFLKKNSEIGIVGSNCILLNENGKKIGQTNLPLTDEDIRAHFFFYNPINHSSIIFRKTLYTRNFYNENLKTTQDYELYLRLMPKTKFANLKECLITRHIHKESISYKKRIYKLRIH